jgi:hypothetical protein
MSSGSAGHSLTLQRDSTLIASGRARPQRPHCGYRCAHLYNSLATFHRKNIALRDVLLSNVVRTQSGYMFVDYSATLNFGALAKAHLSARMTPPEVRRRRSCRSVTICLQ